jgi:PAS domain S-box-containing protein
MKITGNRSRRLQAAGTQLLLGTTGLALITFVCFRIGFGIARTAFAYLILLALVSLLGSFGASVALSIVAIACLNYFFAPPLFDLRVDDPDDIVRIAAFLTTSLVVTALTTRHRRVERELRESKARLELAQRLARVGWWERDLITDRVTVSDEVSRILGVRPVTRWLNLIHPEDRPRVIEAAAAAVRPGAPRSDVEYRVVRLDGTLRVVQSGADVTWDRSGKPLRQFGVLQDITELRRAEQELRTSEVRFRTFVDRATDAFLLLDEDWTLLDVNRQACVGLGYSKQELIGKHKSEFDVGLDDASIERLKQRTLAGEPMTFETRHRRKDGTSFPVEVRVSQFEQDGHRFLCLVRDITERKRAEEALRANQTKLEAAQRIAHVGWWERDLTTGHVGLSDEVCRIFGVQPLELPQWHERWLKLIHPEDRPRAAEAAAAALHGDARYDVEYRVVRPDGDVRIIHSQGDVTWDESGRPLRQFGVLQDITELRQAEKELRASEEALRRREAYLAEAQRLSHTGTLVFDATSPVYWSEESYRIWGLDPLRGLPNRETVLQRIHPDDRERVNAETEEALRQKRDFMLGFRIVLPDGRTKYIESTGRPFFSADGKVVEIVATHVDVTERKRADEEHERLRQLETDIAHLNRVSMMGELAASLAHEILHPIATARNNARAGMRFLERSPPNLGEVKEALACIVRDSDRAKDIVGRMRDHIKKAPPRRELFDLNDAIDEVIVTVRSAIANTRVSVRTRFMELAPILADRVQLQQVVMNLILNAVEAMSLVEDGARELSIETEQSQAGGLHVAVRDSGPGIDPARLDQVFEPFYSTKASGMGMGLSICRSIIAGHGGRLWAEANQPRGSVFQFTLPAASEDS